MSCWSFTALTAVGSSVSPERISGIKDLSGPAPLFAQNARKGTDARSTEARRMSLNCMILTRTYGCPVTAMRTWPLSSGLAKSVKAKQYKVNEQKKEVSLMLQQANIDKVTVQGKEGERVAKVQISYMVNEEDSSQDYTEELMRLQGAIVNVGVEKEV